MKRLFVGNMSFHTTEADLRALFEGLGTVDSVHMVTDRDTGRSRGFAFVEMPNDDEAAKAIGALNGTELDGRTLNVNEARPKTEGGGGGGGARRGGGGGGGGRDRGGFGGGGGGRRESRW